MEENRKIIIFVSDYWGSQKGGVNVVNFELCSAMGYIVTGSTKVAGLVIGSGCTDKQIEEAEESNVTLIRHIPESERELNYQKILKKVSLSLHIRDNTNDELIWVGHDIHTGKHALKLKKLSERIVARSQFSLIIHTLYGQTEQYKKYRDREGKLNAQMCLLDKADKIFCIGPILKRRLETEYHVKKTVTELIPGITRFDESCRRDLHVFTYGSVIDGTNRQKDWEAVCWGLAGALKKLGGAYYGEYNSIIICGFSKDLAEDKLGRKGEELEQRILEKTGISLQLKLKHYKTDRRDLFKSLQESNLFVLNSEFESFSLGAWEAISARVPVIITKTSGVYQYLEKRFGYLTNGLCGVIDRSKVVVNTINDGRSPEQIRIDLLSEVIANIIENLPKMQYATRFLRDNLKDCTWSRMAMVMAKALEVKYGSEFTVSDENNFYENTYSKRETVFDIFERRIRRTEIHKHIILFGGIASRLISEDFIQGLLELLCSEEGEEVHIYYCYEAEAAILQREEMRALEGSDNKNESEREQARKESREKFRKKADKIARIKQLYREKYKIYKKAHCDTLPDIDQMLDRIHIIALNKSPVFYFNFIDDNVYVGFKYETRSSINTTIEINDKTAGLAERVRILNHMSFILDESENDRDCNKMRNLIRELKDECTGKIKQSNSQKGE